MGSTEAEGDVKSTEGREVKILPKADLELIKD